MYLCFGCHALLHVQWSGWLVCQDSRHSVQFVQCVYVTALAPSVGLKYAKRCMHSDLVASWLHMQVLHDKEHSLC